MLDQITKYVNLWVFLATLVLGLIVVWFNTPAPQVIMKYPTPDNTDSVIYRDEAGVCYRYRAIPVPCNSGSPPISIPLKG
jgi:hypothetical protein